MTTPTPPRLSGDPGKDSQILLNYMAALYKSLVVEDQLPAVRRRTAAVDISTIATGTTLTATPKQLATFTDPPTAAEMETARLLINGAVTVLVNVVKAAQVQS